MADYHEQLEKIDELRRRFRLSYGDSRDILEAHQGDLIAALAELERTKKPANGETKKWQDKIVEAIKEGNTRQVEVSRHGQQVTKIPLNLAVAGGALSAAIFPLATAVLAGAAWYTDWSIRMQAKEEASEELGDANAQIES